MLRIRKELGLFANLRPATVFPELLSLSCLRPDRLGEGLDLLVVRELTGGLYFGEPAGEELRGGIRRAFNTMVYTEDEIRRIARVGFAAARKRQGRLCSVDKAMSWLSAGSGAQWLKRRTRTTPMWSCPISMWTTAPCSSSSGRGSSTFC